MLLISSSYAIFYIITYTLSYIISYILTHFLSELFHIYFHWSYHIVIKAAPYDDIGSGNVGAMFSSIDMCILSCLYTSMKIS